MTIVTKRYDSTRPSLKTGDIILFSGKGAFSAGIKWFTNSQWSHVGMVLNLPEYDSVMLWESTTLSNIKDAETGVQHRGVQLVYLSDRVRQYNGDIRYRKLKANITPKMINDLMQFRKSVRGRAYEENKLELLKSAYDGWFGDNQKDLSSLFCSELVAESYYAMGLMKQPPPSNEYTPADWSSKNKKLPLINCSLGRELILK